jgi:hypothetical protein
MNDEIEQLLRNLHLKRMAEIMDDEIKHAEKQQLSYVAFLTHLLRTQYHHRQKTTLAWRIKTAGLPSSGRSSPSRSRQPGVSARQIRAFAGSTSRRAENVLSAPPASARWPRLRILLKAIQNGYRGRFVRAQDL